MDTGYADAWNVFEKRLAWFLSALRDGEALVVSDRADDARYVQFLSFGDDGLHAEVSPSDRDDDVQRLGWQSPRLNWRGKPVGGVRNLTADFTGSDRGRAAAMAVGVLRDVWGIAEPADLAADKVTDNGGPAASDLLPHP